MINLTPPNILHIYSKYFAFKNYLQFAAYNHTQKRLINVTLPNRFQIFCFQNYWQFAYNHTKKMSIESMMKMHILFGFWTPSLSHSLTTLEFKSTAFMSRVNLPATSLPHEGWMISDSETVFCWVPIGQLLLLLLTYVNNPQVWVVSR